MLQIIGICRFAYPGLGGYQTEHESVAAREAHLYDPARMESRLRTLEHVCLRTIARQTDPDFLFLVITGDSLPAPYLTRLKAIIAAVPQARLIQHRAMNHRNAMEEIVNDHIDPDGDPVMQFRQDDDDGVSLKFIARARLTFEQVRPLWREGGRLAVDFNRGYMLRLTKAGPEAKAGLRPMLGVAQALFLRPDIRRTAIHYPHHRLATLMPTITLTDGPMWVRGIDGMNDSRLGPEATDLPPAPPEIRDDLELRFGLDFEAISRTF